MANITYTGRIAAKVEDRKPMWEMIDERLNQMVLDAINMVRKMLFGYQIIPAYC